MLVIGLIFLVKRVFKFMWMFLFLIVNVSFFVLSWFWSFLSFVMIWLVLVVGRIFVFFNIVMWVKEFFKFFVVICWLKEIEVLNFLIYLVLVVLK